MTDRRRALADIAHAHPADVVDVVLDDLPGDHQRKILAAFAAAVPQQVADALKTRPVLLLKTACDAMRKAAGNDADAVLLAEEVDDVYRRYAGS